MLAVLDGLRACGYVRTLLPDPDALDGTARLVREFAELSGMELGEVFRDVGTTAPDQPYLPGFMALVAELRDGQASAVVVPSPGHLSLLPDVRRWMARMIREAGGQLVVMDAPCSIGRLSEDR